MEMCSFWATLYISEIFGNGADHTYTFFGQTGPKAVGGPKNVTKLSLGIICIYALALFTRWQYCAMHQVLLLRMLIKQL